MLRRVVLGRRRATRAGDDLVGYQQRAIWLSRDELVALIGELSAAIGPRLANPATPDRARYLISPILFPVEKPSPGGGDAADQEER